MRIVVAVLLVLGALAPLSGADDHAMWREAKALKPCGQPPSQLLFSPDGRWLVFTHRARWLQQEYGPVKLAGDGVCIVDLETGRVRKRLGRHGKIMVSCGFLPSGRLALVYNEASGRQMCAEYDPETWHRGPPSVVYDAAAGEDRRERAGEHGAFSADGSLFAGHYGHVEGEVIPPIRFVGRTVVRRTDDWTIQASFTREAGADTQAVFFALDNALLVDSAREFADRRDDVRHSVIENVSRLAVPFYELSPSPRRISTVDVWGPQSALALSPDGESLAACVANNAAGSLLIYDVQGGQDAAPRHVALDTSPRLSRDRLYTALAFSGDGRWLVAGRMDGTVRLWETDGWRSVQEMGGRQREVTAIAFSRDGSVLAVGSSNGEVRIWRRAVD